jgi:hypothetical protein
MRLIVTLVLLASCAGHDVRIHYPLGAPTDATGTLVLLLTQPASDVTVSINGVLVTEGQRTQRIVIDRVPVGTADVILAANGGDKQFRTWVGTDHATTVPLGIPEETMGFIKTLAGTLITIIVYSLLHP